MIGALLRSDLTLMASTGLALVTTTLLIVRDTARRIPFEGRIGLSVVDPDARDDDLPRAA